MGLAGSCSQWVGGILQPVPRFVRRRWTGEEDRAQVTAPAVRGVVRALLEGVVELVLRLDEGLFECQDLARRVALAEVDSRGLLRSVLVDKGGTGGHVGGHDSAGDEGGFVVGVIDVERRVAQFGLADLELEADRKIRLKKQLRIHRRRLVACQPWGEDAARTGFRKFELVAGGGLKRCCFVR